MKYFIYLEIPSVIDKLVFPLFKFLCCIGFLFIIGAFINIIIDKVRGKAKQKILKNRNVTNCDIEIVLLELDRIKDYQKVFQYKNYIIRISEYNIDAIIVCDYYGILKGKENDITWEFKNDTNKEVITNPLIEFNEYIEKLKNKVGNNDIRKYILLGSNTILDIDFKDICLVRRNNLYYVMSTKKEAKKYTSQEVDEIYKKICV